MFRLIRASEIIYTVLLLMFVLGSVAYPHTAKAQTLAQRLSGTILIDVETHGEAWFVYPETNQRYFLGRPADAFDVMRNLGLGISNDNLALIPESDSAGGDQALRERLSGNILLQVEEHGEAWYVYPEDLKRYYLGRPADAFDVMRQLGLGITHENLLGIPIAVDSAVAPNGGNNTNGTITEEPLEDDFVDERQQLVDDMNQLRSEVGVASLDLIKELTQAAQAQADDMTNRDYFSLTSPEGKEFSDWIEESGYTAFALAVNTVQTSQPVENIVPAWDQLKNDSYQNIIGERYHDVGIGVGEYQGAKIYIIVFAQSLQNFFEGETADLQDIDQVRSLMLELVNRQRLANGLNSLAMNNLLHQAAQGHTDDMWNRGYYSHDSPEGLASSDRIIATGYDPMATGENIAKGQTSVREVMDGWMNSPGHRENILNPDFVEVGFGLSFGPSHAGYEVLWAQNFAAPR